ncbi:MAG: nuclear transport factor 2 family protein [Phycisphaerales bacterium]|nr:nuclear transport factor 2 family protein [Phycisphaerales bacterium]
MKTRMTLAMCGVLMAACIGGCEVIQETGEATGLAGGEIDHSDIGAVLDYWHLAASEGDMDRYFGSMTQGAVFLGTDAAERWTRQEFRAFAEPYFADGHGWTYVARERFVRTNAYGDVAWVDEILDHDSYGILRGTAVLRKNGEEWRIAHYSLSFLVPNDVAGEVVEVIQRSGSMDSGG